MESYSSITVWKRCLSSWEPLRSTSRGGVRTSLMWEAQRKKESHVKQTCKWDRDSSWRWYPGPHTYARCILMLSQTHTLKHNPIKYTKEKYAAFDAFMPVIGHDYEKLSTHWFSSTCSNCSFWHNHRNKLFFFSQCEWYLPLKNSNPRCWGCGWFAGHLLDVYWTVHF